MRWWAAAVVAVTLIQLVWSAWAKPLSEGNTAQKGLDEPISFILRQSVGKLYWSNTREMIGVFGWLDTLVPNGDRRDLAARDRRARAARRSAAGRGGWRGRSALTIAFAYLVPVGIETCAPSANNLVWHGRYTLPFAVGIPLLGGYAWRRLEGRALAIRRVAWWLGAGSWSRRCSRSARPCGATRSGSTGRSSSSGRATSWTPPVPSWLLVVGYLAVMAGLVWWVLRSVWDRSGVQEPVGACRNLVPA